MRARENTHASPTVTAATFLDSFFTFSFDAFFSLAFFSLASFGGFASPFAALAAFFAFFSSCRRLVSSVPPSSPCGLSCHVAVPPFCGTEEGVVPRAALVSVRIKRWVRLHRGHLLPPSERLEGIVTAQTGV